MGYMQDVFGDITKIPVKIYEPYIEELYRLSSIEQMVVFQQSRSEQEHADRLNDRDTLKGYCDSTAINSTSAIKIGNRFYTSQIPNNVGFQDELITPYFTQRDEPEMIEHTLLVPLYDSDDVDDLISACEGHTAPVIAIVKSEDGIEDLKAAGITVLGYVDSIGGTADNMASVIADWGSSPGSSPDGLFIDNIVSGRFTYFEDVSQIAESCGFSMLIGAGAYDYTYFHIFDVIVTCEDTVPCASDDGVDVEVQGAWLTEYSDGITALLPYFYFVYATIGAEYNVLGDIDTMLSQIEASYA
jgi:hypothetical protein